MSEEYINELLDSLPLSFCFVNPLGVIVNANNPLQNLTGYLTTEMVGKNIDVLFFEKEEIEIFKKEISESQEKIEKEMTLLAKDKRKILIRVIASGQRDKKGNFNGYFLIFSEIKGKEEFQKELEKEVKQKTKALKESSLALLNILDDVEQSRLLAEREKNKTLAVIENFPEGLLFFNKENKLTSVNFKIQEIFGIKKKKLILGKKTPDLLNKYPSFTPLIKFLGEDEVKTTHRKELELKKDLILEVSVIPVVSKQEKLGTLVILRNITREKIVERLKSEFVSIAAHQLRTPLSSIKWVLKMILDGDLGSLTQEQRIFLEKTYKGNEKMIRLINDLLNVTKIEEGRIVYRLQEEDIIKIIKEVMDVFKEQSIIQNKNLKFEFIKPEEEKIIVQADREKLFLAFQNLIDNAFHYTPIGGNIKVVVKHLKDEGMVLTSIQDSGIGIPEEQQKRVFTRFFRATNTIKENVEGTGLGLFIAKNIIESHDGKIWFESKENQGSSFYFSLPVKKII